MKKEIPECIILDAQSKVYERKDTLARLIKLATLKQKDVDVANADVLLADKQLRETLDFLQEHNSDAHSDWYAELGMKKHPAEEDDIELD